MSFAMIVKLALVLSIFLFVFALALKARAKDVFHLLRHWRHGLSAFLAIFVVVPVVAVVICSLFDLNPATKIAIIALAVSPVPPFLPKGQVKAGGPPDYVTGLLVLATILSVVVTPLALSIISQVSGHELSVDTTRLIKVLMITVALPLILGLIAAPALGKRAAMVSELVGKFATLLLAASALILLVLIAPAMWQVLGNGTLIVLIAMCAVGLAAGYLLGGPEPENRVALSLAAAARHPGVAIAVAASSFPDEKLAPAAIILATIVNTIVSTVFKKKLAAAKQADALPAR